MEFLKINDLSNYFCNLNSSYILVYYVKNFIVYDSPITIIQNKYSLENPLLLVQNISFGTFYVSKDINLFYFSLMFQQGLPYSIENALFNESSLQSIRSKLVLEKQMGMQWGQQIFICKISYHFNYTTIIQIANQTFTINDTNQIIQFKTEFNPQNSKIFFSTQVNQFLIIQNKTIRAFSFDKKVNLVWIMKIHNNITNIFRYQNILLIQLGDCIDIEIDLNSLTRKQINNSLQFNCTYYLNSYFQIKIYRQEINLYSMFSYHLRIICNEIVEFVPVVIYKRLIIFELIDNKIQIKLYITRFGQFNFLFYLPLYEFQILYPLEYRIEKSQIAIVASNQMDQEFVLVYDIKNQVANCLVKVIRIDNKNYYFNFLSEFQIFVVFQQQLIILFLSCLELQFSNQHLTFDNLISQEDLLLQIISDIYNQSLQIQLKVISINMNYKIQIKDVMIPFQYQINQQLQIKSFNLLNIYGNIDFMIKISENNTQRLEPMQINYAFSCSRFFLNSTCIIKNNIIFNTFDNSIQMEIPESCVNLLFVQDKKDYFSFYCWFDQTSFERLDVNIYGVILKEKTLKISDFNINLYMINQTQFLQNVIITYSHNISNQMQIWFVKEDSVNLYFHKSNSRFNTATVIYLNNHYIIFYTFLEENKNIILCAILMDDLLNIQNQIQIELTEIIKDYNFVIFQQLIELKFIEYNLNGMILNADSIFCFAILSCIRLNLDVDFQLKIIKSQINNYIRFPENALCYFNCFQGNQQNIILTLIKDNNRVSYFYNLTQKILIDSYYQYSVQNVYFQQYNKSHYILINKKNNTYEVNLLYLSGYQIQCQDQCQTNVEIIQIYNQISNLYLEFHSNQDQNLLMNNSKNYIQIIICLNNFIFLLSFLIYRKKRRNQLK
ncbi:unnamed protein product [Paramecium pentaurelia]|uniref:Transmembrane protein n=1 Tax=Paramecium pentaurelia TaxID=43138 RepID=A0A8S1WNW0_9CILI|nr:unnamed protein product [Paramecium pentaurelia]